MSALIDQNNESARGNQLNKFNEPELAFTHFFETFHLEEVQWQLARVRESIAEKKMAGKPDTIEEDNLELFFEKLELLIAAAWKLR